MDIILFYNFNSLIWLTGIVEVVSTCSRQPKLIICSKNDNNNYNVPFLHVFNWKSNKQYTTLLYHSIVNAGKVRIRDKYCNNSQNVRLFSPINKLLPDCIPSKHNTFN